MPTLWICRNCNSIGKPSWRGRSWFSSAPACSSCGHRTTLPIASPKGLEIANSLGITAQSLREMEWRSYLYWPRVFWLVIGGCGLASIAKDSGTHVGLAGLFCLFAAGWGAVSLFQHFRARPRR